MRMARSLVFCLLVALIIRGTLGYMRVCYYTNWSQFAPTHRFVATRIPAQLCTHIVFAYANLRAANITTREFNDIEMYGHLNRLKRDSPNLQIILAVGGWAAGGSRFSRLVSDEASMLLFTNNTIAYLRKYHLDGVSIDWEYPTASDRGSISVDRERYTRLLQIIRSGINVEAERTGRARLSLSAAVEANITEAGKYYQIREIGRILDVAFLMTYDFHGYWDSQLGALHHSSLDPDIRTCVEGWIQAGFPANKLLLGVSGFGRSFTLANEPTQDGSDQVVIGGGAAGASSRETGLLDYGEICSFIAGNGWTRVWLAKQSVPVAYGNTTEGWQWVGYDDPQSLSQKAAFIRHQNLAGVVFWSLEHDDFSNICNNGTWPLLRTLAKELPDDSSLVSSALPKKSPSSPTTTLVPLIPSISLALSSDGGLGNVTKANTSSIWSKPSGPTTQLLDLNRTYSEVRSPQARFRQCKMSEVLGPTSCPVTRGKLGDINVFYLYCSPGFLAIECRCLPGHFFNRCIQTCDVNEHFSKCPIVH